ncbi:MAG: hypothetical protein R2879_21710 [Saprospiraceae bacterium]
MQPLRDSWKVPAILKMGDNISTDEILRAGVQVLSLRSNIPAISDYAFTVVDETFPTRAKEAKQAYGGHIVVAGENYAQGSSREHAALAPRFFGQVAVIAKNYARIGWQNLVNFGILPLEFEDPSDYEKIYQNDILELSDLTKAVVNKEPIMVKNVTQGYNIPTIHRLSERQIDVLMRGGIINWVKEAI